MNEKPPQSSVEDTTLIRKAIIDIISTLPKEFVTIKDSNGAAIESAFLKGTKGEEGEGYWGKLITNGLTASNKNDAVKIMDRLFRAKFQSNANKEPVDLITLGDDLSTLEQLAAESTDDTEKKSIEADIVEKKKIIDTAQNIQRRKELKVSIALNREVLADKKQKARWSQAKLDIKDSEDEMGSIIIEESVYIPDPQFEKVKEDILSRRTRPRTEHVTEPIASSVDTFEESAGRKIPKSVTPKLGGVSHIVVDKIPQQEQAETGEYKDYEEYSKNNHAERFSVPQLLKDLNEGSESLADVFSSTHVPSTFTIGDNTYTVLESDKDNVLLETFDDEKTPLSIPKKKFYQLLNQSQQATPDQKKLKEALEKIGAHNLEIKELPNKEPGYILEKYNLDEGSTLPAELVKIINNTKEEYSFKENEVIFSGLRKNLQGEGMLLYVRDGEKNLHKVPTGNILSAIAKDEEAVNKDAATSDEEVAPETTVSTPGVEAKKEKAVVEPSVEKDTAKEVAVEEAVKTDTEEETKVPTQIPSYSQENYELVKKAVQENPEDSAAWMKLAMMEFAGFGEKK